MKTPNLIDDAYESYNTFISRFIDYCIVSPSQSRTNVAFGAWKKTVSGEYFGQRLLEYDFLQIARGRQ